MLRKLALIGSNVLWSPDVAALGIEKRRLRRVWHNSGKPKDMTEFKKAAKELKELLSNLC